MGFIWIGLLVFCLVAVSARESERAELAVLPGVDGWDVILCFPSDAGPKKMAIVVEMESVGEGPVLIEPLSEGVILTVGETVDRRVCVLVDGDVTAQMLLFRVSLAPRIIRVELWVMNGEGEAVRYPLNIREEGPKETEMQETDPVAPETGRETESLPETETADGETETVGTVPTAVYLGCRETPLENGTFSVRLLFWCDAEALPPAVICLGGGQTVTLSVERLCGSSVVAVTYRELQADTSCRFRIDTSDGIIVILYEKGKLQYQKPLYAQGFSCLIRKTYDCRSS